MFVCLICVCVFVSPTRCVLYVCVCVCVRVFSYVQFFEDLHPLTAAAAAARPVVGGGVEARVGRRQLEGQTWETTSINE